MKITQRHQQVELKVWYRWGGCWRGTDENRIRLHRPGSHRLPEMGNRFKAGTVCWQVWIFFSLFFSAQAFPFPFFFLIFFSNVPYTFNQTRVKTCLHVMKRSGTCSSRVSYWRKKKKKNLDALTVWISLISYVFEQADAGDVPVWDFPSRCAFKRRCNWCWLK